MQKYTNSITPSAFALFKGLYSVERTANADGEQRQIFESHVEEMKYCTTMMNKKFWIRWVSIALLCVTYYVLRISALLRSCFRS